MKPRFAITAVLLAAAPASAGGLFLPGAGAVSTSRAGAAAASTDDGEALAVNPAGLAKAKGTTITVSITAIDYIMQFTRRGSYDQIAEEDQPYEGQPYPTVKNNAKPSLGIGAYQPVPVIAIVSDLGGKVPGLHVAAGIYAPNAYPFRDMTNGYVFNSDFGKPPPPTRYDILTQSAAVILPSIGVAYRVPLPKGELDVGGRFSLGTANLKSTTAVWGVPANYEEWIRNDGEFSVDASDNLIHAWGLGVTYRPTPFLEFAANYTSEIDIHAKGTATSTNGTNVNFNGNPIVIGPPTDDQARCAPGGTATELKACIGLALPMTAQLAARYKFVGADGDLKGDVEVDLDWENWGKTCSVNDQDIQNDPNCVSPTNYRVTVDGHVFVNGMDTLALKDSVIPHGLQDTYAVRVGGSYHIRLHDDRPEKVILRGGIGYDTAAATPGWLRNDLDGAARTTITVGAAYKTAHWEFNLGGGTILEGSPSNPGNCDPTGKPISPGSATLNVGCDGSGVDTPVNQRQTGPDPVTPILNPNVQIQKPVDQGDWKSHYIMFMLGATTWF